VSRLTATRRLVGESASTIVNVACSTFSGHTFVSPQVNRNPEVALDTLLHEISHAMDVASLIDREAAREHVRVPPDLWQRSTRRRAALNCVGTV
jgi:hypothetical protein